MNRNLKLMKVKQEIYGWNLCRMNKVYFFFFLDLNKKKHPNQPWAYQQCNHQGPL